MGIENSKYKAKKKVSPFQIRWNEALGEPACPYAYRWVLNLGIISFRIHYFIKTEPMEHLHNHAWDFITFILKGGYIDVGPSKIDKLRAGSFRYRKAEHLHKVVLPKNKTCLTFVISFKPKNKWGFLVKNKILRPIKYFHKYGNLPCSD